VTIEEIRFVDFVRLLACDRPEPRRVSLDRMIELIGRVRAEPRRRPTRTPPDEPDPPTDRTLF
jgi:hypothetical protein